MALYASNLAQKVKKWRNILVVVRVLIPLVRAASESIRANCSLSQGPSNSFYRYEEIKNSIIESGELDFNHYQEACMPFRFIKEICLPNEEVCKKQSIIVERIQDVDICHQKEAITCFYREADKNSTVKEKKDYISTEWPSSNKSIFISQITANNEALHNRMVEEARMLREHENERVAMIMSIDFLFKLANRYIYIEYIKEIRKCKSNSINIRNNNRSFKLWLDTKKDLLRDMENKLFRSNPDSSMFAHLINKLLERKNRVWLYLIEEFEPKYTAILEIYNVPKRDRLKKVEKLRKEFIQNMLQITSIIKDIEKQCTDYSEKSTDKNGSLAESKDLLKEAERLIEECVYILSTEKKKRKRPTDIWNVSMPTKCVFNMKKVQKKTAFWNRDLVFQLLSTLKKYENADRNIQTKEAIEMIREENRAIVCEIKKTEQGKCIEAGIYASRIGAALKQIVKVVGGELDMQQEMEDDKYKKDAKISLIKATNNENLKIVTLLLDIFEKINIDVGTTQKKKAFKSVKSKIYPLIYVISKHLRSNICFKTLNIIKAQKKKRICDLMLQPIYNSQLFKAKTESVHLESMKKMLICIVKDILDVMFYKHREIVDYRKSDAFKKMLEEEEKYITCYGTFESVKYLLWFANNFWHVPELYSHIFKEISSAIASPNPSYYIKENWDIKIIEQIINCNLQAYKYINYLSKCDEVWKNSAILYLKSYTESESSKKRMKVAQSYITYKLEKNSEIYVKMIDFTSANLKAFKDAKTTADLEAIAEKKEDIKSLGETDEKELEQMKLYRKSISIADQGHTNEKRTHEEIKVLEISEGKGIKRSIESSMDTESESDSESDSD